MKLETVIGLEIHVQLKTKSKMFCSCSNEGADLAPNTTVCQVCLGHPGTLPVPNKLAVEWSIKSALALGCDIPKHSKFDRKHYFYPDLPKAYQISQFDEPIGTNGSVDVLVEGEKKTIRVHRLHLEEDAAKLTHGKAGSSLVDYNRGGTPLMEIVSEADMRSPKEAGAFLRELRLIMRYLNISDADMEKGHLRCDANISLRPEGDTALYPKTEIKNLNSFKAVERALEYEEKRQARIWEEEGKAPDVQGTRGWDESTGKTTEQRTKEDAQDYRYFPEPDIPELDFDDAWVSRIQATIPELPAGLRARFVDEYAFSASDAQIFSQDFALAEYTENVVSELKVWLTATQPEGTAEEIWEQHKKKLSKIVSSWLLTKLLGVLKGSKLTIADMQMTAENMAELITMIHEKKVNNANALLMLEEMVVHGGDPSNILEEKDLGQMSDDSGLDVIVEQVIAGNEDQVAEFKAGKEQVLNFLVGMVMKQSKGKADPGVVQEMLREKLG